jgi:hypothetical protein
MPSYPSSRVWLLANARHVARAAMAPAQKLSIELEIHCSDEIDFSSDSFARLFFQGKIGCDS